MAISVYAGRVPGEIKQYGVDDNATVGDVLRAANITLGADETVNLNGDRVETTDEVEAASTLLVTRQVKGN